MNDFQDKEKGTYGIGTSFVITIETKTKLDHSVDSGGMDSWIFKWETRGQEGGFVQEHNQILKKQFYM